MHPDDKERPVVEPDQPVHGGEGDPLGEGVADAEEAAEGSS